MEIVLKMLFFTLSNVDIQFAEKKLTWRSYTGNGSLRTTWKMKIINRESFAKAALDKNIEVFIVHMALPTSKMIIHPARKAQIAFLIAKKVTIPAKYSDFAGIFLKESAGVLAKRTGINKQAIELEKFNSHLINRFSA